MKIGNVELKNDLFLAPMAGVTDSVYREICYNFGAALTVTEMVSGIPAMWKSMFSRKKSIISRKFGT